MLFSSCLKDKITRTYSVHTPIYETPSAFRSTIKSQPAVPLASIGKITVYGKYIFLSEPGKGIHVIDNSNPSTPKNISFINVPGNEDIAIKGNALYADSYADLVTFDISDPANAFARNFATYVFADHSIYYAGTTKNPDSIQVVVGWKTKDTTVSYNPSGGLNVNPGGIFYDCINCSNLAVPAASNSSTPANNTGTNGSTARFAIINNFLYTVSNSSLATFDITDNLKPISSGVTDAAWNIETIYPLHNTLLLGTTTGMFMFDVQSSPASPTMIGGFEHVRTCDPVIGDGNYAYVTLRSGTPCQGYTNELDILNITDMSNPQLISVYKLLNNPRGLSKDNNNLFICDGPDGLKVFNVADATNVQFLKQLKDTETYDVIAENGVAIVIGSDGLYEYDYSDVQNIHLLSKL